MKENKTLERDIVRNYLNILFHVKFHKLSLISRSKNWQWKTNFTCSTQGPIFWRQRNGEFLKFFQRPKIRQLLIILFNTNDFYKPSYYFKRILILILTTQQAIKSFASLKENASRIWEETVVTGVIRKVIKHISIKRKINSSH